MTYTMLRIHEGCSASRPEVRVVQVTGMLMA